MNLGHACKTLSSTMHQWCDRPYCQCPCHIPSDRGGGIGRREGKPRPHSYPRLDWQHKKPAGWHEARKRGEPVDQGAKKPRQPASS